GWEGGAMRRRDLLRSGVAVPLAALLPAVGARAQAPAPPVSISDMHFHSFFGKDARNSRPVGPMMANGHATPVASAITGDGYWIHPRTLKQIATPRPGDGLVRLHRQLPQVKAHMAEQGLKPALTPADVDAALRGEPHIVLAVEGATFIESDPGRVKLA